MDKVWSWHEELAAMGPRYTGQPGPRALHEWLQQQFSALPGFQLRTDPFNLRWLAQDCSLSINQDATVGPSGPVPVSYYYPYSGTTGPVASVASWSTSACTRRACTRRRFWAPANSGIALVRMPPSTFSSISLQLPTGGFEPGKNSL